MVTKADKRRARTQEVVRARTKGKEARVAKMGRAVAGDTRMRMTRAGARKEEGTNARASTIGTGKTTV